MKITPIPEAITAAAVSMLAPYAPNLTPARLESAIAFKQDRSDPVEKLLSRKEAATALHISLPTIDRMLASHELGRVTVRGRVFIRQGEVQRIISGN